MADAWPLLGVGLMEVAPSRMEGLGYYHKEVCKTRVDAYKSRRANSMKTLNDSTLKIGSVCTDSNLIF